MTERDDGVLVGLFFTSLQAAGMGRDGERCTWWTLDDLPVLGATGAWRIERATGRGGGAELTLLSGPAPDRPRRAPRSPRVLGWS